MIMNFHGLKVVYLERRDVFKHVCSLFVQPTTCNARVCVSRICVYMDRKRARTVSQEILCMELLKTYGGRGYARMRLVVGRHASRNSQLFVSRECVCGERSTLPLTSRDRR